MSDPLRRIVAWLESRFPIATWLPDHGLFDYERDLVAGLTVGVMIVPQAMAYAVIAGLPPIYGLYASVVPLLAYALMGTSKQLISGPLAIDMVIVGAGVGMLAAPGSSEFVALAILLAAMVGAVQIAMGFMQLGFLADLLSRPVIAGFTSAAALIIGFSQLGNLLGIDLERSQYVYVLASEAAARLGELHVITFTMGLGSLALLLGLARWRPSLPGPLIVIVAGTLLTWGLGLQERGVAVVGEIPSGLPPFELPAVSGGDLRALLPTALTLALVQFTDA